MIKKRMIASLILLLFALALIPVATYAWFTYTFASSSNKFSTGKLEPQTDLYYWDKVASDWAEVPVTSAGNHLLYPNFGEITNLMELPSDFEIYLKMHVDDTSEVAYKWDAAVADIIIIAMDVSTPQPTQIKQLDYYEESDSSQKCFYYATALGEDGLNPTTISTYGTATHLATKAQSLSDDFVPSDKWLYVHVTASITELQNIIRRIPIDRMPYMLEFAITIIGEGRTID